MSAFLAVFKDSLFINPKSDLSKIQKKTPERLDFNTYRTGITFVERQHSRTSHRNTAKRELIAKRWDKLRICLSSHPSKHQRMSVI
jgi:hypothetical protein